MKIIALATARHTQKKSENRETNYKLTQQTLLTNLR